jgi:hypothetical protein
MEAVAHRLPELAKDTASILRRYLAQWADERPAQIAARAAGVLVIAILPGAFAVWLACRVVSFLRVRNAA